MMCPHCGESVLDRTPMTRAQREVYAAIYGLQADGRTLTLAAVAHRAGRAESTAWYHIEHLAERGWIDPGGAGRAPFSDWTLTRPLDPDGVYLALARHTC